MHNPFQVSDTAMSHDTTERHSKEASTSFDMTRFLAGSKGKLEETQAATRASEARYSQNEIHAQREFAQELYDQEQQAIDPAKKVPLAHDYAKGGADDPAKKAWKDSGAKARAKAFLTPEEYKARKAEFIENFNNRDRNTERAMLEGYANQYVNRMRSSRSSRFNNNEIHVAIQVMNEKTRNDTWTYVEGSRHVTDWLKVDFEQFKKKTITYGWVNG